jgi:hypothetical protein
MAVSGNSLERIPEFSVVSDQDKPIKLPNSIIWNGIQLSDDQVIIYINEEGSREYISKLPFDDNKYYREIILFDYSQS